MPVECKRDYGDGCGSAAARRLQCDLGPNAVLCNEHCPNADNSRLLHHFILQLHHRFDGPLGRLRAQDCLHGSGMHAHPLTHQPQRDLCHFASVLGTRGQCFLDRAGVAFEEFSPLAGGGKIGVDLAE